MGGKTDVVKGRIKEAAGADRQRRASHGGQDRPGGRQGKASCREGRRQDRASREKSAKVKLPQSVNGCRYV